jgi:hypothetical protein
LTETLLAKRAGFHALIHHQKCEEKHEANNQEYSTADKESQ